MYMLHNPSFSPQLFFELDNFKNFFHTVLHKELYSVYTDFFLKAHDWCHLPGEVAHCWDLEETGGKNAAVNKNAQIKPKIRNLFFLWYSKNT